MKSTKSKKTKFLATVDEDKIEAVKEIASELRKDGVIIENASTLSGIITGSADDLDEVYKKFKSKGLKSIEKSQTKQAW